MFNANDYNENVEYCEYVFRINEQEGFNLSRDDIQAVANAYAQFLSDAEVDEHYENDEFLIQLIDEHLLAKENALLDQMVPNFGQKPVAGEAFVSDLAKQEIPMDGPFDLGNEGVYGQSFGVYQVEEDQLDDGDVPPTL